MTSDEHRVLTLIAQNRFTANIRLAAYLEDVEIEEEQKPKAPRTDQQNRAMWLDCELIAAKMEAAGVDWKAVIREGGIDIPVTKEAVMDFMWRPVMFLTCGAKSTRDLPKTGGTIERIHETIMRALGEKHGIEWHDFPSDQARQLEELSGPMLAQSNPDRGYEYPDEDNDGRTAFDE